MSCSWDSLCLVDDGRGSKSRRFAISEFIRSRRSFDAPFVDFVASKLCHRKFEGKTIISKLVRISFSFTEVSCVSQKWERNQCDSLKTCTFFVVHTMEEHFFSCCPLVWPLYPVIIIEKKIQRKMQRKIQKKIAKEHLEGFWEQLPQASSFTDLSSH